MTLPRQNDRKDFVSSSYPSNMKTRSHSTPSNLYAGGAFENAPDPKSLSLPSNSFMLNIIKKPKDNSVFERPEFSRISPQHNNNYNNNNNNNAGNNTDNNFEEDNIPSGSDGNVQTCTLDNDDSTVAFKNPNGSGRRNKSKPYKFVTSHSSAIGSTAFDSCHPFARSSFSATTSQQQQHFPVNDAKHMISRSPKRNNWSHNRHLNQRQNSVLF
jgi:hypothetical protein